MARLSHLVLTGSRPSKPASRSSNQTHQIVFYAFDVLHVNGRDVTGEPLMKRRASLPEIIGHDATLRLSQVLPGSATEIVKAVRAAGLEGVIAKRDGARRCFSQLMREVQRTMKGATCSRGGLLI
jgi:ATP-dependent DNA ligase